MRYSGLPESVVLKLVERIRDGAAGGQDTHNLLTFALDTTPDQVPAKLAHEIIHGLLDLKPGLLTQTERRALDVGAEKYLAKRDNRADIEASYGNDSAVVREEAIARMAEAALERARRQPPGLVRALHAMVNLVQGTGQALRGEGLWTWST